MIERVDRFGKSFEDVGASFRFAQLVFGAAAHDFAPKVYEALEHLLQS